MRFFKSVRHAWRGIVYVLHAEPNFILQIIAYAVLIFLGILFHLGIIEWLLLIMSGAIVLVLEMINTAVEKILDVIKPRLDERVGLVKDIMAGAVLLSSVSALIIGFLVFIPRFLAMFY